MEKLKVILCSIAVFALFSTATSVAEDIPNQCQPYVEKALNELNKNVEENNSHETISIELPERPFDDKKSEEYDNVNESTQKDGESFNSQEEQTKADTQLDENGTGSNESDGTEADGSGAETRTRRTSSVGVEETDPTQSQEETKEFEQNDDLNKSIEDDTNEIKSTENHNMNLSQQDDEEDKIENEQYHESIKDEVENIATESIDAIEENEQFEEDNESKLDEYEAEDVNNEKAISEEEKVPFDAMEEQNSKENREVPNGDNDVLKEDDILDKEEANEKVSDEKIAEESVEEEKDVEPSESNEDETKEHPSEELIQEEQKESIDENAGETEDKLDEKTEPVEALKDEAEKIEVQIEEVKLDTESSEVLNIVNIVESEETVLDAQTNSGKSSEKQTEEQEHPEEDLLLEFHIPDNLRDRAHIAELLHLGTESSSTEQAIDKTAEIILRDLKRTYDNAIKPLEHLYKYRDLSNRHFGDPEIFSKPLILFMGPWSGGKSTILNYLSDNEYTPYSVRSGAEPSPAYFNILMHGDEPEVLDGTQLAADWTFSGLQKFGQGMLDRLRGVKLPNKLLEKVNLVEIPGILEVRKQVSRLFPFNDACQWFIDRADIIFLVYDPSKLDVGPETEAILDQLKGREYQTRILLNKADTVKPEELLRVQGALIWNISPLMSSAQPPVLYTVSLWSHPYTEGAPARLLQAQERALLRDVRESIDKRVENKIASARRFAVRVRNHAKMVDCYLTTYYNHKTLFANKKQISDNIIENPQNYHIYEGLSTLTNISRYDLPDPEVYRDFFRLNPLYTFKRLSETCTYFKGCPINKLDVAIAYDLPDLGGKYKKLLDEALHQLEINHKSDEKNS